QCSLHRRLQTDASTFDRPRTSTASSDRSSCQLRTLPIQDFHHHDVHFTGRVRFRNRRILKIALTPPFGGVVLRPIPCRSILFKTLEEAATSVGRTEPPQAFPELDLSGRV
ncbi:MAG: hypothetical protein MK538_17275, partial [Planctomycetes bacterium]|nr:hypothetical protein [Planctomycetota bacterium]